MYPLVGRPWTRLLWEGPGCVSGLVRCASVVSETAEGDPGTTETRNRRVDMGPCRGEGPTMTPCSLRLLRFGVEGFSLPTSVPTSVGGLLGAPRTFLSAEDPQRVACGLTSVGVDTTRRHTWRGCRLGSGPWEGFCPDSDRHPYHRTRSVVSHYPPRKTRPGGKGTPWSGWLSTGVALGGSETARGVPM